MALTEATKEAMYLKRFLVDIGFAEMSKVKIFCDNNALKLAENPVFHNRSKHIDVRHHYVREILEGGNLEIAYTPSEEMPADILTKAISKQKHIKCLRLLGIDIFLFFSLQLGILESRGSIETFVLRA